MADGKTLETQEAKSPCGVKTLEEASGSMAENFTGVGVTEGALVEELGSKGAGLSCTDVVGVSSSVVEVEKIVGAIGEGGSGEVGDAGLGVVGDICEKAWFGNVGESSQGGELDAVFENKEVSSSVLEVEKRVGDIGEGGSGEVRDVGLGVVGDMCDRGLSANVDKSTQGGELDGKEMGGSIAGVDNVGGCKEEGGLGEVGGAMLAAIGDVSDICGVKKDFLSGADVPEKNIQGDGLDVLVDDQAVAGKVEGEKIGGAGEEGRLGEVRDDTAVDVGSNVADICGVEKGFLNGGDVPGKNIQGDGLDVVCDEKEVASKVEVEQIRDANEEVRLGEVRDDIVVPVDSNVVDISGFEKDCFVNVDGKRDKNALECELDVATQALKVEKRGSEVWENKKAVGQDKGDNSIGDCEKGALVGDEVDPYCQDMGLVTGEGIQHVKDHEKTDGIEAQSNVVSVGAMSGLKGETGDISGTEKHYLLNDGENGEQTGSGDFSSDTRLIRNESKQLPGENVSDGKLDTSEAGNKKEQVYNLECKFSLGDVVWVKTKKNTWWPGRICEDTDISAYDATTDQPGHLRVTYFGINSSTSCNLSELKPFYDDFEHMSMQNKSKSFQGAVEKAVHQFGRCVKEDMICPCLVKGGLKPTGIDSTVEGISPAKRTSDGLGKFAADRFLPGNLLGRVRGLAMGISISGVLELAALKNSVSAFYLSVGHNQLPIYQLLESLSSGNEDFQSAYLMSLKEQKKKVEDLDHDIADISEDSSKEGDVLNKMNSSQGKGKRKKCSEVSNGFEGCEGKDIDLLATPNGEGTGLTKSPIADSKNSAAEDKSCENDRETRERKKSKYLSYPYVIWEGKGLPSELKDSEAQKVTPDSARTHAAQFVGSPSTVRSCSSKRFQKTRIKKFMKMDAVSAKQQLINASSAKLLSKLQVAAIDCLYPMENDFDLTEWFISRFRASVYLDDSVSEAHVRSLVAQNEATMASIPVDLTSKCKPEKQKKQVTMTHPKETHMQDLDGNADTTAEKGSHGSLDTSYTALSNKSKQKIGSEGAKQVKLKSKLPAGLSDVNIKFDTSGLLLQGLKEVRPVESHGKPEQKRRKKIGDAIVTNAPVKNANTLPDLNANNAFPIAAVTDVKKSETCSLYVDLRLPVTSAVEANPLKTPTYSKDVSTSSLQYTDGKGVKSSISVGDSAVNVPLTAEAKPRQRGRKRKEKSLVNCSNTGLASSIPDLNGTSTEPISSSGKLVGTGSDSTLEPGRKKMREGEGGTALLLTFAPGSVMPSKEILVATFSRFGPLKGSETQLLKTSGTAQVVFAKSSNGIEAFRNLEETNPFGAALVHYRLHQGYSASVPSGPGVTHNKSQSSVPVTGSMTRPNPALNEAPSLEVIKKNLDMMTAMLKRSGDNLSPEMRDKLEGEIKVLLEKVTRMVGSSSS